MDTFGGVETWKHSCNKNKISTFIEKQKIKAQYYWGFIFLIYFYFLVEGQLLLFQFL